jgi:hypothetical protein
MAGENTELIENITLIGGEKVSLARVTMII